MTEVWAEIDLRVPGETGEGARTKVAGMPPFIRQLKQAQKLGWAGARLLATNKESAWILETLNAFPSAPGFVIETDLGDLAVPNASGPGVHTEQRRPVHLDGRGLYSNEVLRSASSDGQAAKPGCLVHGKKDVTRAESWLLAETRKPLRLDGALAFFVLRPLSRLLTRPLLRTPISANLITAVAMITGLVGAYFVGFSTTNYAFVIAGCLYFSTGVLDCVDGELARLRYESSRLGEWLDSMTDETTTMSMLLGLGVYFFRADHLTQAVAIWASAGIGLITLYFIYRELVRRKLPIDTAVFPWFFWESYPDAANEKSLFARFVDAMGYLTRRDVNVTVIAVLLCFSYPLPAAALIAGGYLFFFILTVLHFFVSNRSNKADSVSQ